MKEIVKLILSIFDLFTQQKIINALSKKIKDNKINILLDVGSHKGDYISSLNKKFSIENIYCFEPNPDIFEILKKKFNKPYIKLFNYGISKKRGNVSFNKNIESSSSSINDLNSNSKYYKKKFFLLNLFKAQEVTTKINIKVERLDNILNYHKIEFVDLLKVDTEGYELNVIESLGNYISKIKIIHFEHHFDDMILKNYNLTDIHELLIKNGFKKFFKIKMKFRKSFEYIYINKNYI